MNAKMVVLGAVVVLALLLAAPALADDTGTGTVHGVLSDDAVVAKAVTDATVTVGGMAATVSGSSYSVTGVPAGLRLLVVTAPRHLSSEQWITVLPGDNTFDLALSLTAKETYLRYYAAYNHRQFAVAWKMVHPDVKGHLMVWGHRLTYTIYQRDMRSWKLPFVSMRIEGVKTDATWRVRTRARLPHAVYHDIVRIDRIIRYKFPDAVARELDAVGHIYKDDCYIHWQKIDGRWYTIFDFIWFDR